jgi:hypothetical protein
MNHEAALDEIVACMSRGDREAALDVLRNHYAIGLKDGKEIAGWSR